MALFELLIIALLLSIVFLVIAFFNYARALEEKVEIAINSLQARTAIPAAQQFERQEDDSEETEEAGGEEETAETDSNIDSGEEGMRDEDEKINSKSTLSTEQQDSQRKRFYEELNRARNKTRALTEKAKTMRKMLENKN